MNSKRQMKFHFRKQHHWFDFGTVICCFLPLRGAAGIAVEKSYLTFFANFRQISPERQAMPRGALATLEDRSPGCQPNFLFKIDSSSKVNTTTNRLYQRCVIYGQLLVARLTISKTNLKRSNHLILLCWSPSHTSLALNAKNIPSKVRKRDCGFILPPHSFPTVLNLPANDKETEFCMYIPIKKKSNCRRRREFRWSEHLRKSAENWRITCTDGKII